MTSLSSSPIGVFDSGVGGLSVLRELVRLMPDESYLYLGDSARVPYGNKSPETVTLFAQQCAHFLCEGGVKLIVVACNTVSAVALEALRQRVPVPVIGMIRPAAAAALTATITGQIGVVGTRATINSDAYARTINELQSEHPSDKQAQVHSLACPLFVPLAEEGWIDHPASHLVAQEYMAALTEQARQEGASAPLDTLVLGCTHYPLLKPLLQNLLPDVTLIDCGEHAAKVAQNLLQTENALSVGSSNGLPNVRFYLTDVPPTFRPIAERFLGFPVAGAKRVSIDEIEPAEIESAALESNGAAIEGQTR